MRPSLAAVSVCSLLILSTPFALAQGQVQAQNPSAPLIQIGTPGHLYSDILGEDRPYWIHLPEGYSVEDDATYPVIYLLDGESHLVGLASIQAYYNYFRLPEMIVVAISNADNRTRDLTPTEVASRNGAPVDASGGADRFRSFLSAELIPHIDATYATSAHRVLMGHSYAGLFTIHTLLEEPGLFTNYVALDPSLDWDDGRWLEQALPVLASLPLSGHGLFVALSNEIIRFSDTLTFETVRTDTTDFSLGMRSAIAFVEAQDRNSSGLSFSWKFYPDDIHGSVPLMGMRDAIVDLYDFWELKKPSLYNDPETPADTILALIRAQSQAREAGLGYPLPMERDLLEMLSFFYADVGQPQKAKQVLLLAAEYYPEAVSVHEALAEVCTAVSDEPCAREHAAKADALNRAGE
ncbi:MAG: alpha/beta hydrolase-fold protein [Rhodothermales bacterium]